VSRNGSNGRGLARHVLSLTHPKRIILDGGPCMGRVRKQVFFILDPLLLNHSSTSGELSKFTSIGVRRRTDHGIAVQPWLYVLHGCTTAFVAWWVLSWNFYAGEMERSPEVWENIDNIAYTSSSLLYALLDWGPDIGAYLRRQLGTLCRL